MASESNSNFNSNNTQNRKANLAVNWKSSTKIDALMQELHELLARDPTIKSIVFSQWTSMVRVLSALSALFSAQ